MALTKGGSGAYHARSPIPFFSAGFINRLQKMIRFERGPPTQIEHAIERVLRRLADVLAALGR